MPGPSRAPRSVRAAVAGALAALLLPGCTYLGFAAEKKRLRSEAHADPSLGLARESAPEDCFQVAGRVARTGSAAAKPLLVAALAREPKAELVASREVPPASPWWGLLLPSGRYDLVLVEDRDGDGFFDASEAVATAELSVGAAASKDGFVVDGPELRAGATAPSAAALHVPRAPWSNVVSSLDDPMFDPPWGETGMYRPTRLLARTQGLLFGLEPFDRGKTTVLFVHGINGTPRDFRDLAAALDRARFQPWFFYYPSGMPLDKLGVLLARVLRGVGEDPALRAPRVVVVAHSMGGLVARRALNEICAAGRPAWLKGYVSFATPYGGTASAAKGLAHAPEVVPSWRDVAAGSDFLVRLHGRPLPPDLPFHLFFAWGTKGESGPAPAGDGVVSLSSQLDPRVQGTAARLHGYEESHVGILANPHASRDLHALLAEFAK